jgi:muconolactone delta-isomerase
MKLLCITKVKDSLLTMPPAVMRQILEASAAAIEQQKKQGKVLEYYYSPAGYNIVILDYKDAEEWAKDQLSVPVLTYVDTQVYPLTDGSTTINGMIEVLKATEQMMPGTPQ